MNYSKELKVRKIGNSLGSIFPKEWEVHDGQKIKYEIKNHQIILDLSDIEREHDRKLIEDSFLDFKNQNWLTESEMQEKFGKYGWCKK